MLHADLGGELAAQVRTVLVRREREGHRAGSITFCEAWRNSCGSGNVFTWEAGLRGGGCFARLISIRMPFLRSLIKATGLLPEGNGSIALSDLLRREPTTFDLNPPPACLVKEPTPAGATPDLGTLVLVHGNYWKDAIGQRPDPLERQFLLEPARKDDRFTGVLRRYHVYFYQYPTHLDVKVSGAALALELRRVLPARPPAQDLVVIAHSLGGLVARHGLQDEDIAERVRDVITLATPHHGTVLASLVMADARIREKVGLFGFFCQRMSRRVWPITPGLMGMAYDNWDNLIPARDVAKYGIHVNEELHRLNQQDRVAGKITALMGRVRELRWLENRNIFDQVPRWIMGRIDPVYQGLDPLVHLESGLAFGLRVKERHALDGLDHETIATDAKSRDIVFDVLLGGKRQE